MKFLILNGPNINMLGVREPEIYGKDSYEELLRRVNEHAAQLGVSVDCFQSNHEGALVDAIQGAYFDKLDGIVFNPAAYTHTVKAASIPTVEVHISDVSAREDFRQISYIRAAAVKTICGQGLAGYEQAMDFLFELLKDTENEH